MAYVLHMCSWVLPYFIAILHNKLYHGYHNSSLLCRDAVVWTSNLIVKVVGCDDLTSQPLSGGEYYGIS